MFCCLTLVGDKIRFDSTINSLTADGFIEEVSRTKEYLLYSLTFKGLLSVGYENAQKESSRQAEELIAQKLKTA